MRGSHADGDFEVRARAVVVAAASGAAAALLGGTAPADRVLTTVWHLSDAPLGLGRRARYLHVSGDGSHRRPHGLVNTVVVSRSAPGYLPPALAGRADLVATTVLGTLDDEPGTRPSEVLARVRAEAGHVLGVAPARLGRELAVHEVRDALPRRPLPLQVRRPVDLGEGRVVVGDSRDTPSIQGALVSGRRGARAVLDHLGLRPAGAASSPVVQEDARAR